MNNRSVISSSNLAKSALVISLAVFFAVIAAGGTYALWSDSATVPGATISAGSAALSVTSPAGIVGTPLYPGDSVTDEFSVENTGDVVLDLSVDALTWPSAEGNLEQQAFADAVTISVWPEIDNTCPDDPPPSAWTPASPSDSLGVRLETGAVQYLCIDAELGLNAPNTAQGGSLDFQLTLGGVQA